VLVTTVCGDVFIFTSSAIVVSIASGVGSGITGAVSITASGSAVTGTVISGSGFATTTATASGGAISIGAGALTSGFAFGAAATRGVPFAGPFAVATGFPAGAAFVCVTVLRGAAMMQTLNYIALHNKPEKYNLQVFFVQCNKMRAGAGNVNKIS
jgi:hypothetical protein